MTFSGPGASAELKKGRETNATTTAYALTLGQIAEDALPDWFVPVNQHIGLFPLKAFGVGSSGDTFLVRLLGAWRHHDGESAEYHVEVIATFTVTLGDNLGASGRLVSDTERFAWSLGSTADGPIAEAFTTASPVIANGANAAGNDAYARIEDLGQPDMIGFDFDLDGGSGGTPTSANVIYRLVS